VSLITAATLSLTQRSGDETADYGGAGAVEANTADGRGVTRDEYAVRAAKRE